MTPREAYARLRAAEGVRMIFLDCKARSEDFRWCLLNTCDRIADEASRSVEYDESLSWEVRDFLAKRAWRAQMRLCGDGLLAEKDILRERSLPKELLENGCVPDWILAYP